MAHKFDTGQASPQRTRIRRGAVALLSGLTRANGGYLMSVIPWGGIVRVYTDVDGVASLQSALKKMPAIAIAVGDRSSAVKTIGGYSESGEIDLLVYFVSNNTRQDQIWRHEADATGRADDMADPGLDIMMEHAKELLIGQRAGAPGNDIKQLKPVAERELYTDQSHTIWVQEYQVTTLVQISEFRTVTQLLNSIRFRAASNPAEVPLPASASFPTTTLDLNQDNL